MKKVTFYSILFFTLFCSMQVFSAPPPPPTSAACWPPPCVPIDGGISFLIAAGAAYGAKKLYDKKRSGTASL